MSNPITSTWLVDAVIETTDGGTIADLRQVERREPDPDVTVGLVTVNVTDGPELHVGDNVRLTVEVIR